YLTGPDYRWLVPYAGLLGAIVLLLCDIAGRLLVRPGELDAAAEGVPIANDIENTGNTSAASVPLAIEEMLVTGKAKGGQLALLLGFGAGLSYAGQVVTLPPAPKEPSF
ncbi:iron chelate uptake ABC transporter family permease subunit, partial [Nocardia salmonicida]|uniref:iron chelate uptake ABC transporter family permease subunit n=1 Tax=Nocardia salmonicida TaxID=53431 RepID=UPI0036644202